MTSYIPYGLVIGTLVGLFVGIFWFEMGLSLLAGSALGLLVGAFFDSFIKNRKKLN